MDDPVLAPDVIKDVDSSKLDQYLEFSRSACVPGGGFNSEQALEMLYKSDGDILRATRRLIHNDLNFPVWSRDEITQFERLIAVHGKNFYLISKDLRTKSVKECVEFYYLWKRSVHRSGARNHRSINIHNNININNNIISANNSLTSNMNNNNNNSNNNLHNNETIIKLEMPQIATAEIFPCKICGRIFEKIKSRSAHMKRHKNEISN